ncbi:MAG: GNAT family N-acetyltransferase [Rubrivivax sp.]|nr:GNAT family N-acetyltransferase [Rubrivivax sp.]
MSDMRSDDSRADTSPGLLARFKQGVKSALGAVAGLTAPTAATAQTTDADPLSALHPAPHPALHPALKAHAAKVMNAADAVAQVRAGDHVFIGTACATPRALVAALEAVDYAPADVELLHFLTDHAVPHDASGQATTRYRHRTFFVGLDMRAAVKQGLADYVPLSIARVPGLMAIGRIAVDVAFIQVSLPDEFGYVSLGISVDVIPAAVRRARLVIAEVNPSMPRTMGDSMLHVDQIHTLVPVATPVIEYQHPAVEAAAMEQIARYIGGIIEDGSTLQIGLGRITNAALKHLSDRQDLGVHSDVITDAIIPLLEKGILTGRRKSQQTGKIVTSFAMGSRRLYDLIDRNPMFSFQPIETIADPATVASQHKMVSVTQAFAVDLTGQVCADQYGGDFYGGLAAQGEFLRGASRSPGGKPIICLASTNDDGSESRIRPQLLPLEAVTVARTDVHYVITEFGIAYLFGKSIRERAVALIEVAHPQHRATLFAQAQALGYIGAEQTLKNLRAYPVEEEMEAVLKGGRGVLIRPSGSTDADGIRDLFHRLSDRDRYTRFFRKVRGLSNRDVQRLCNMNFENEVAFVAASGSRENPQIVAQACYFTDPGTNLAETAFMVHPDWQGCGLGAALQARLAAHARGRGVRGFVAEIMASNEHMIRLARSGGGGGGGSVSVDSSGSTVRVTQLFEPRSTP